MVLMTNPSPSARTRNSTGTKTRARDPPRQRRKIDKQTIAGIKNLLPLKNGITESRNGLASRWLTNRNRATSNGWAQDIELYWKAQEMLAKRKSALPVAKLPGLAIGDFVFERVHVDPNFSAAMEGKAGIETLGPFRYVA